MRKQDYAYIAYLRKIKISPTQKLYQLKALISSISCEEAIWLRSWHDVATLHSKFCEYYYKHYTSSEVAIYLAMETRYSCPISSFLDTAHIVALYHLGGHKIPYTFTHFNEEQLKAITPHQGLYLINAGPGTGKTTTAIERAYRLQKERVLIVSYSNEAVREVYNRFKKYPGVRGTVSHKKMGKSKIVVTTVDSLAAYICGYQPSSDSYDHNIRMAIALNSWGKITPFKHIIVDEAQDVDDERATLILSLAKYCYSVVIFGDPRQRIKKGAGYWYAKLWTEGLYRTSHTEYKVNKIGFNVSHRFTNQRLISLHNDLSVTRPDLHVDLTSPSILEDRGLIKCFNIGHYGNDTGLSSFAQYLKTRTEYSPSDIAVIIPSIAAENCTSRKALRLCAIFKDAGISCYVRNEGAFCPNGVLISTIQSIKGKEFKLVILYCMSEYPRWFPMIPHEEADSLIYVAHTRAKCEMMYLCNDSFICPRNVPCQHIDLSNVKAESRKDIDMEVTGYAVTDINNSHSWPQLLEANGYTVAVKEYLQLSKVPDKPAFIDERLWGIMCGLIVETLLINKHLPPLLLLANENYIVMTTEEYNSLIRNGTIINGMMEGCLCVNTSGINALRTNELSSLKHILSLPLATLTWSDWKLLTQIYDFLCGDHMNSRYDMAEVNTEPFPYQVYKQIVHELIGVFGNPVAVEGCVGFALIRGQYDILFTDTIMELKTVKEVTETHRRQVMMYNAMLSNEQANTVVYNLHSGVVEYIVSPQDTTLWKYIIDAYGTIRFQVDLITSMRNRRNATHKIPNMYVADTEFYGGDIFDYAVVDLNNPYKSVVQPVRIREGLEFAVKWTHEHNDLWNIKDLYRLYDKAVIATKVIEYVKRLPNAPVGYFVAGMDVVYSQAVGMKAVDLSALLCEVMNRYGSYASANHRACLGEIYDILVAPMEFYKHLHQHSALTDALLLYSIIHLIEL